MGYDIHRYKSMWMLDDSIENPIISIFVLSVLKSMAHLHIKYIFFINKIESDFANIFPNVLEPNYVAFCAKSAKHFSDCFEIKWRYVLGITKSIKKCVNRNRFYFIYDAQTNFIQVNSHSKYVSHTHNYGA